ncbi:MAG TPA: helix-turn-helix transcriptional regulator [Solirubrobacteraceae bacterium]|jgi:transcriptional regulator with XRE-family HTH domain|nr:helix-turn-helix transcriptional regulator [Solirubrobacteraceae bacterium]
MPPRRRQPPRSPEHAALGEAIRRARVALGYSQEDFAGAADIHITLIGGLERGVSNPNYTTLLRLSKALGTTPGALLTAADKLAAGSSLSRPPSG